MLEYPNANITLTGHSSGGAFAVLAGLDLVRFYAVERFLIYTYGQPRIGMLTTNLSLGNKAFAQRVNAIFGERIHRVTFGSDLVTYMPSRNFLGINRW
jgi:predicted lipase